MVRIGTTEVDSWNLESFSLASPVISFVAHFPSDLAWLGYKKSISKSLEIKLPRDDQIHLWDHVADSNDRTYYSRLNTPDRIVENCNRGMTNSRRPSVDRTARMTCIRLLRPNACIRKLEYRNITLN